jgi:hypothetical protein
MANNTYHSEKVESSKKYHIVVIFFEWIIISKINSGVWSIA